MQAQWLFGMLERTPLLPLFPIFALLKSGKLLGFCWGPGAVDSNVHLLLLLG